MLFGAMFLVTISLVDCWRPFVLRIYNPEYKVYYSSIADLNLTIEKDTINMYFDVHQNLHNPIFHIEYIVDSGNDNYDMVLANKTYNVCSFLENRKMDLYLQLFIKIAEKFANIPKRCPMEKKLYYIKNMKVDSDYLPPVMPEKKGYAVFSLATNKENKLVTIYTAKIFFKIEPRLKNEEN